MKPIEIKHLLLCGMLLTMASGYAATDYSSLNGLQGAALKEAVKQIALRHKAISYPDATWKAFEVCDVREITDPSLPGGSALAWFDMYSNRLVWVSNGHSGMNIEHSVANSWWGGVKNDAYKDLHHLNPSDGDANGRKSNWPLGIISGEPTWSNGLTSIGAPTAATGGGSKTVFEPADEYKGDFARAYFYVFTIYDNISWINEPDYDYMYDLTAYPTLKPWAYNMLLTWAAADPVDEREAKRNQDVASIQENENPFIAIPGLAEYVWGSKRNTPFNLADAQTAPLPNRPAAPNFAADANADYDLAGVNTWTGRWWKEFQIDLGADESVETYYNINGSSLPASDEWIHCAGSLTVPAATQAGEVITIKAYCEPSDRPGRRSSISSLTLTAAEEGSADLRDARWVKVSNASEIDTDSQYILVAEKTGDVMSTEVGTNKFITVAGSVLTDANGEITRLPENTAIVEFVRGGGNQYYVEVSNLALNTVGYISTTAAKKADITAEGMPAVVTLTPEKNVSIDFGTTYGTLQYNASSPRFSVYTSKQVAPALYRCVSNPMTGIDTPAVAPAASGSTRIFTIDGLEILDCPESELPSGLYIIVTPRGVRKVRR
ncbi:MAG: endonuclease [Muribaculaceae bacterium]|nr:endonuclease [Muribaculaceae bacterium]